MSVHARKEMAADELTVWEVESCILTGSVFERQRDRRTGEWKHLILGRTLADADCVAVVKRTITGRLAILTVFVLEG